MVFNGCLLFLLGGGLKVTNTYWLRLKPVWGVAGGFVMVPFAVRGSLDFADALVAVLTEWMELQGIKPRDDGTFFSVFTRGWGRKYRVDVDLGENTVGMRVTWWGAPAPVSEPGRCSDDVVDVAASLLELGISQKLIMYVFRKLFPGSWSECLGRVRERVRRRRWVIKVWRPSIVGEIVGPEVEGGRGVNG